jgi:hypothetical protein
VIGISDASGLWVCPAPLPFEGSKLRDVAGRGQCLDKWSEHNGKSVGKARYDAVGRHQQTLRSYIIAGSPDVIMLCVLCNTIQYIYVPLSPYHDPSIMPQYLLYQTFYAPAVAVALICHLAPQLPCSCCIAHSYCTSGILMHLFLREGEGFALSAPYEVCADR